MALASRDWVPPAVDALVRTTSARVAGAGDAALLAEVEHLADRNHQIHDVECVNLNPATNVMNPRGEALLAAGLGTRASLGYPGEKYETGLEAIEEIEAVAASLVAEVFDVAHAEVRVPSGAMANLYAFLATCRPGDTIVAPPASIGGHVTHHDAGAAGLLGLRIVPAPVLVDGYTVDVDALRDLVHEVQPALVTIGGSLNLFPHPVAEIRQVADEVGARVLFDAAHLCGMVAGGAWPHPLREGADLMTMSTYKSLGGPPGGLVVTDDPELAQRIERIAYPGLTANHDAGRVAALAVTMLDWRAHGRDYATTMVANAAALAEALTERGVPLFAADRGATRSHQLAVLAEPYGGGQTAAHALRRANLLACGIGLPMAPVDGDLNGLRIGTPEITRLGMTPADMPDLADLIVRGLGDDPDAVASDVTAWRAEFSGMHYVVA